MHQFWTKHLESFAKFIDLMIYFFFNVGSFMNLVADMDIHAGLEDGEQIP
jgi:hypothetical protein